MPRYARHLAPDTLHHLISRCVDGRFRIDTEEIRLEYLRRLGAVLERCDWRLVAYAIMSNHVHLVAWSGNTPSARLIHPLHSGFARWLNAQQDGLGPVFAARHTTISLERGDAARLLAYVHNNPVRAGVFATAADAPAAWTSHRAYLGREPAPPWLDVELGLSLCDLRGHARRTRFEQVVAAHAGDPRDPLLSESPAGERRAIRAVVGAPVEVSDAHVASEQRMVDIVTTARQLRPRWPGSLDRALGVVATYVGVSVERMASRSRAREVVAARRLALLTWSRFLGGTQRVAAGALGVGDGPASRLVRQAEADGAMVREATVLAEQLWREYHSGSGVWIGEKGNSSGKQSK